MLARRIAAVAALGFLLILTACQTADSSGSATNPSDTDKKALEAQKKAFQQQYKK
jgi:hypothetical protein